MERNGDILFNRRRQVKSVVYYIFYPPLSLYSGDGLPTLCTKIHSNYPTALLQLLDSFPYFHTSDSCSNLLALSCFDGNSALLSLIEEVWGIPHITLHSSRQKMETIGILRRIINNLLKTVKQVGGGDRERK